jgi:catechol 2,3-dioxygenase-like lactoylglutathione lyase family enzyme
MPALRLDHVNVRVPTELLDTLRSFYIDILGLKDGFRPPFGSVGHWLYAGDQPVLHLSVTRNGQPGPVKGGGAVDHIAFACEDFSAMCRRLESLGIEYRTTVVPVLEQRQVFFRDPAGNGVELNFGSHDD